MTKPEPHVTDVKRKEVEDIKNLAEKYKVMGVVNLENLPAFDYMKIKNSLRNRVKIKYTKKRLMKIAFDENEGLKLLKDRLIGIPVLIFTNEEPFKLAQVLKKSETNAPAKAGDVAPVDIIIQAGPTEFTPGPMIGELGALGIKTKVEGGKVNIVSDKLLVKAGEVINRKNAGLMSKLKLDPMKIGMNLVLTYQDGEILEGAVLNIYVEDYVENIKKATVDGIALAMYLGYVTKETAGPLIAKASLEVNALANKINFFELIDKISNEKEKIEEEYHLGKEANEKINDEEKEVESGEDLNKGEVNAKDLSIHEKKEDFRGIDKVSGISDIDEEDMKKAKEYLDKLTSKKLRGEI